MRKLLCFLVLLALSAQPVFAGKEAVKISHEPGTGNRTYTVYDTQAEVETSGLVEGNMAYANNTHKLFWAISSTAFNEICQASATCTGYQATMSGTTDQITVGSNIISLAANARKVSMNFIIEGAGTAITTGAKGYIEIPFGMVLTGWTVLADVSGGITINVKKSTYADFPTTTTIVGADKPTLVAQQKNQNLTLSLWTTTLVAGDVLEIVVDTVSTVTRVTVCLRGLKS